MSSTFIASSMAGALNALSYQGVLVPDSYVQLRAMLEKNLSAGHALLFAEPVRHPTDGRLDWFTPLAGPVAAVADLDSAARAVLFARVRELAGDIEALAARLQAESAGPAAMRGHILALALSYPGPEHLYAAGGQPLLTGWGHAPAAQAAVPESLSRLGAAVPVTAASLQEGGVPPSASALEDPLVQDGTTAPLVPVRGGRGLAAMLCSLLLGLGLAVGLFALAGAFFAVPGADMFRSGTSGCSGSSATAPLAANATDEKDRARAAAELTAALAREKELSATLAMNLDVLRDRLSARMEQCLPPEPEEFEEPETPPEPPPDQPPSLAELMPTTPDPDAEEPVKKPPKKKKPKPKPKRAASGCGRPIPV